MNKKLILFGTGKITEVIHYYATEECGYDVVAFCVDDNYLTEQLFLGKPVVGFSKVQEQFPPNEYDMFVAIGYHELNEVRKRKCNEAQEKGYNLVSIIPDTAKTPSNTKVGFNCFIMPPAIIHPCVTIGNNVFVWSGAMIGHHSIIEDNCWITSTANLGGNVVLGEGTFVAMNATISHSVKVGKRCFLGANILVGKELKDGQVVIAESSKPIRLNSTQFLKMSKFSSL